MKKEEKHVNEMKKKILNIYLYSLINYYNKTDIEHLFCHTCFR